MQKIIFIFALVISGFLFAGCGDFGGINSDPNNPTKPDTRFLYVNAVRVSVPTFSINDMWNAWTLIFPQYVSEKNNVQFTKFQTLQLSLSNYYSVSIRSLEEIISLNTNETTKNDPMMVLAFCESNANQIAVARTLRAYIYMHMTDAVGMIPYSEANKGLAGNFRPKYDTQQSIYTDLNKELEEAYSQFDINNPLDGNYEILYGGDIDQWKKFNASVRMQLAIKLFKVDENKGKTNFAKAFNQGFIRDNADILRYQYLNESSNQNPMYNNIIVAGRRDYWPCATLIDSLVSYHDPRVSAWFTEKVGGGYAGIPFAAPQSVATGIKTASLSYWQPYIYAQNAPLVLISPSVMLLTAAEAAERGWITASAKNLYEEAITASLEQHGVGDEAAAYLAVPKVVYKTGGTQAQRIAQIAMQKWLASFMQDGFETWADWRRLGVPALNLRDTPKSVAEIDKLPRRRIYDTGDYDANKDNYNAAISAQGADVITTRVWWDK